MKNQLLVALISFLSLNCFSQTKFEKGYFINNENEKTECLIKNLDWKNNPIAFEYKLSNTSNTKIATIKTVKEFSISNTHKYNRFKVNIERSSENINHLDTISTPVLNEEQLFLKTLVDGKAILYAYEDPVVRRFFYKVDNSKVTQLIFKIYMMRSENLIRENNKYKQQLWFDLKCQNISMKDVENVDYKKNELINFFVKFNECNNSEFVNFEEINKKDLFNLTIRPGFNSSSLSIKYTDSDAGDIGFDNNSSFRFGIETEFIMPFYNNKWSLIIEPTYQYFKSENSSHGQRVIADYKSIELPIGIRYYFFLNDKSKIFINGLYVSGISLNSSIQFENGENLVLESDKSLEVIGRSNFAFGGGYNINNKYSMEIRYGFNRNIFSTYPIWNSKYNTLSIIIGYSIF